jgi:hypothetical protein
MNPLRTIRLTGSPARRRAALAAALAVLATAYGAMAVALRDRGLLDLNPNLCGIGSSPYGKTLGMVIQSPIDAYWHAKGVEDHHDHGGAAAFGALDELAAGVEDQPLAPARLLAKAKGIVSGLGGAVKERNNPHALTQGHQRYLRRQIERKLATAYWFDPTNYTNYNAYHLFLSEAELHTREVDFDSVLELCDRTLEYVEREQVNPEPWLTGAAAMVNKLEILFFLRERRPGVHSEFSAAVEAMRRCLMRHEFLRDWQQANERWEIVPQARREAMEMRHSMLLRLLDAQETILRERLGSDRATH